MTITVTVKGLGNLLTDLGRCYLDPVSLKFSDVTYKRGRPTGFTVILSDAQVAKIKARIRDNELKDRYRV